MALIDQYTTAHDEAFVQKVRTATLGYCVDVMSESASLAGHSERASFAQRVLAYPANHIQTIAEVACAHNATLATDSPDQTIKDSVASIWSALSGFSATP
jgi:hypothetical protein